MNLAVGVGRVVEPLGRVLEESVARQRARLLLAPDALARVEEVVGLAGDLDRVTADLLGNEKVPDPPLDLLGAVHALGRIGQSEELARSLAGELVEALTHPPLLVLVLSGLRLRVETLLLDPGTQHRRQPLLVLDRGVGVILVEEAPVPIDEVLRVVVRESLSNELLELETVIFPLCLVREQDDELVVWQAALDPAFGDLKITTQRLLERFARLVVGGDGRDGRPDVVPLELTPEVLLAERGVREELVERRWPRDIPA